MKVYKVGGCIRDFAISQIHETQDYTPNDIDYVVTGSSVEEMLSLGYAQVGASFPVFLCPETGDEYALARIERRNGKGYLDFDCETDSVTLGEDLHRRDFTMNAMAISVDHEFSIDNIYDPFDGLRDIENKTIRHVNPVAFKEDPLRILRGCRFAATLGFSIHETTLELFREMVQDGELDNLVPERIWIECTKVLSYYDGNHWNAFSTALHSCGAYEKLFGKYVEIDYSGVPGHWTILHTLKNLGNISKIRVPSEYLKEIKLLNKYDGFTWTGSTIDDRISLIKDTQLLHEVNIMDSFITYPFIKNGRYHELGLLLDAVEKIKRIDKMKVVMDAEKLGVSQKQAIHDMMAKCV